MAGGEWKTTTNGGVGDGGDAVEGTAAAVAAAAARGRAEPR